MADQAVGELIRAQSIGATDLFLLEQGGVAKSLAGQVLLNWLTAAADGHGGISKIEKLKSVRLADTYRITLADTTIFDFTVNNGKSIAGINKTGTQGLVDTYNITYNDGPPTVFKVTNGAKGDKGDNAYTWVKYAAQKPTEASNSIGDVPDNWIGIYAGNKATAPTDWMEYQWFQWKGNTGNTGAPAKLVSQEVKYQVGDSGSIIPSGNWQTSVPVVPQGKYLWTRMILTFNSGSPVVSYAVSHQGLDGSGSVSSVSGVSPDPQGNVPLTAENVGALPTTGGDMTGPINMNGQPITGLNPPTGETEAATKGYVDGSVRKAAPRNLLDNSDFRNPVNQRGVNKQTLQWNYFIDRWIVGAEGSNVYFEYDPAQGLIGFRTQTGGNITLIQRFPVGVIDTSKAYTYAYKASSGNVVFGSAIIAETDAFTQLQVYLPSGTAVEWIALYEGEYTSETLPEYQPKGYGAELLECQRCYQIRSTNNIAAVDMRPTMRLRSPTITSVTDGYAYSADL